MEKFSYSKLATYEQCPYKYKLMYVEGHFISQPSIATDFGSLVHYVEETMGNTLKEGKQIDYAAMVDLFLNADIEEGRDRIIGVNKIKERYPNEFITPDKTGRTYVDKAEAYIDCGICRLENYLLQNPNLRIVAAEQEFSLKYRGYEFKGSIDRIFQDKITGQYIIEDIKTYSAPLDKTALVTPLQFVIYASALENIFEDNEITCYYELPLCNVKQQAGTKGFIKRGYKKIDKLLDEIEAKEFAPSPCPLCHWCVFSATYPDQPEKAKNLCPYFSHWTKENKDHSVENEWMGEENHLAILEQFINSSNKENIKILPEITISKIEDKNRRFLLKNRK